MTRLNKAITFQKVIDSLEKIDNTFTINDIYNKTGIRAQAIKRALLGLEELGKVKFVKTNKIYIKINNINEDQSSNIIKKDTTVTRGQKNDIC